MNSKHLNQSQYKTLKDLKEKLQSFLDNLMNLNSLNGLDGNNLERLVALNKKILKKKQYIEQKEEKLKGKLKYSFK